MRIACRINSSPTRWGVMAAMVAMVAVVAIVIASLRVAPLEAQTALPQFPSSPPPLQPAAEPIFTPYIVPYPVGLPALHPSDVLQPVELPADLRTYQGKQYKYVKTLTLRVTAYAPDPRCTYPYKGTTTASGLPVTTNRGRLVAADTGVIPLHSLVSVPGYAGGTVVPVLDRGGAIKGNRLDVLLPTFEKAQDWGVKILKVKIYRPLDS